MADETKTPERPGVAVPVRHAPAGPDVVPPVDVLETPDALVIVADVPGVAKEKLDVALEQGVLTIRGEVESGDEPGMRLDVEEYGAGGFHRTFTVGSGFDATGVEATVKDGVLRLVLRKAVELKRRRIEVKEG